MARVNASSKAVCFVLFAQEGSLGMIVLGCGILCTPTFVSFRSSEFGTSSPPQDFSRNMFFLHLIAYTASSSYGAVMFRRSMLKMPSKLDPDRAEITTSSCLSHRIYPINHQIMGDDQPLTQTVSFTSKRVNGEHFETGGCRMAEGWCLFSGTCLQELPRAHLKLSTRLSNSTTSPNIKE